MYAMQEKGDARNLGRTRCGISVLAEKVAAGQAAKWLEKIAEVAGWVSYYAS